MTADNAEIAPATKVRHKTRTIESQEMERRSSVNRKKKSEVKLNFGFAFKVETQTIGNAYSMSEIGISKIFMNRRLNLKQGLLFGIAMICLPLLLVYQLWHIAFRGTQSGNVSQLFHRMKYRMLHDILNPIFFDEGISISINEDQIHKAIETNDVHDMRITPNIDALQPLPRLVGISNDRVKENDLSVTSNTIRLPTLTAHKTNVLRNTRAPMLRNQKPEMLIRHQSTPMLSNHRHLRDSPPIPSNHLRDSTSDFVEMLPEFRYIPQMPSNPLRDSPPMPSVFVLRETTLKNDVIFDLSKIPDSKNVHSKIEKDVSITRKSVTYFPKSRMLRSAVTFCFSFFYCVGIYNFIWFEYNQNTTILSSVELQKPFYLYFVMVFVMSLWMSIDSTVANEDKYLQQGLRLRLKYENYETDDIDINRYCDQNIGVSIFAYKITAPINTSKCYINLIACVASLIYALMPSCVRLWNGLPMVPNTNANILFVYTTSFIVNFIIVFVWIRLAEKTAIDILKSPIDSLKIASYMIDHRIAQYKHLPYLHFGSDNNVVAWLSLRHYLFARTMRRVSDVEVWITSFIVAAIVLFGICANEIIVGNNNFYKNDIFLSNVLLLLLILCYVVIIFALGTRFANLQRKQERACVWQNFILSNQMKSNSNETEKCENLTLMQPLQDYVILHPITPKLWGRIKLDQVLWRTFVAGAISALSAVIITYIRSK